MDLIFCVNGLLGIDGTVSPKTSETTKALCRICFRIRAWASDHPKHDRFGDLLCRNVMFVFPRLKACQETRLRLMTGSHVWEKEYSEASVGQGEMGKYY